MDHEELPERLPRGDKRFLRRVFLVMGVAILGSLWAFSALGRAEIGGCVAKGFGTVTAE